MIERQTIYCQGRKCTGFVEKGCFMDAFRINRGEYDVTKAFQYIRKKRNLVSTKSEQEKIRESVRLFQQHSTFNDAHEKWEYNFFFTVDGNVRKDCCMKCFAEIHGFTRSRFEKVAKQLKSQRVNRPDEILPSQDTAAAQIKNKRFMDSTIHPSCYNEARDIFEDNCHECNIPEEMVRASITPSSDKFNENIILDKSSMAVAWLEAYFDNFADKSPNSELQRVNTNFKQDVYDTYKSSPLIQKTGKYVGYTTFLELWSTIFPYAQRRPWCNIPGSCNTCYLIHKRGKESTDFTFQKHLRDLHTIHRGVTKCNDFFQFQC